MKRVSSLILTLIIIIGMFSCVSTTVSAEQEVWKSSFITSDFVGNTTNVYSNKFFATDKSTGISEITSTRSFNLTNGFGVAANLTMSNSTASYLGEYCAMKVGNVELRIVNTAQANQYSAKIYVGDSCIGTSSLGSSPNGKYRLFMNEDQIWAMLDHNYLVFTDTNNAAITYLPRPTNVNTATANLSFRIAGNGSAAANRYWADFMLSLAPATKYHAKDVYLRLTSYDAATENAYFVVPDRTTIYTGDRIHLDYSAYSMFTWPDGTQQTEWNMRADNGQRGQPANGFVFTFLNEGEHYIASSSFGYKLITFNVVDRFYAPTDAQEEETNDTVYPDGSSLPFTDNLVEGDQADIYNNPIETGTFFTSDIWQAVPLISQELLDLGYSGGEGCQLINSVTIGTNGKLAFLGTDVGGLYKSTDGGTNWYLSTVGFDANGATGIAIDPKNNNKVLCIGASSGYDVTNGIYMSTDAGDTWNYIYSPSQAGLGQVGYHGDLRVQIAYDASSYDENLGYCKVIYWSRENNTSNADYNRPAIYKSTDGGYTWNEIPNSIGYGGAQIRVSADTGWVYVNANNGIHRSKDGGNTWQKIFNEGVNGFDMVYTHPSNLYAINTSGYHVSTDYGETWDSFMGNKFETNGYAMSFAVSPVNPDNVIFQQYYSSYNYETFYSNDGGHNWATISIDYTGLWHETTGDSVYALAWSPIYKNTAIISGWGGIYKSINGGSDFFWSNAGFNSICGGGKMNFNVNHPEYISIASQDFNGGYSTDSGKTWTYVNWGGNSWGGFTYGSYILNENTIITGVSTKMYGSETYIKVTHDGGKTIESTGLLISGNKIGCGALGNDNIAFIGEYRTTDGGYTFSQMTNCTGVFTVDLNTGRLFGTNGATVVTSTDNGATWTTLCSGISSITDIAYSSSTNTLYAVNNSNLYSCRVDLNSTQNTFSRDRFGQSYVTTVAVDPRNENVIYVGCSSNQYHNLKATWRSLDGGYTWTNLTRVAGDGRQSADGGKQPLSIRVSPVTGELFVLTGCRGVWKISAPPQWYLDANMEKKATASFGSLEEQIINDINTNSNFTASSSSSNITYVYTKADLYNIRNNLGGFYVLMNDIEFTASDFAAGGTYYNGGKKWSPYLPNYVKGSKGFYGIFYGNGYTISGIEAADSSATYLSIFGLNHGLIMNTGFVNCTIGSSSSSTLYATVISAQNYGQILNCYVDGCTVINSGGNNSMITGYNPGSVTGCYASGTFSTNGTPYAIISYNFDSNTNFNNYYLSTMASAPSPFGTGGTALTASKMKQQASYLGFDFVNVWQIDEGNGLPTLRHFTNSDDVKVKPVAAINATQAKMRVGSKFGAKVTVTDPSGNPAESDIYFYTTTPDIVSISETGEIFALDAGTAYVYAAEYNSQSIMRLTIDISYATLLGDVSFNDKIDSIDLLMLQQHILGFSTINDAGWYNCDIKNDGVIDATDLTLLQMIIVGYSVA